MQKKICLNCRTNFTSPKYSPDLCLDCLEKLQYLADKENYPFIERLSIKHGSPVLIYIPKLPDEVLYEDR